MSAYYSALVALVILAAVGTHFLRKAADKAWAQHQATRRLAADFDRFKVVLGERLIPAIRQMGVEFQRLAPAMQRLAEAMQKAGER